MANNSISLSAEKKQEMVKSPPIVNLASMPMRETQNLTIRDTSHDQRYI